jgi:hypothetical protein
LLTKSKKNSEEKEDKLIIEFPEKEKIKSDIVSIAKELGIFIKIGG